MVTGCQNRGMLSDDSREIVHCRGVGGRLVASGGHEIVLRGSRPIPIDVRPCVAVG
jgi:hypothetical protein